MGSAQSYISSEVALTTLVIAGAIGLGYAQISHGSASTTPQTDKLGQKKGKKKQVQSTIVLSGNISNKSRANTNDKSQQHLTTSSTTLAEPGRVVNTPGFPGQFEATGTPHSQLSDVAAAASSSSSKAKKSKKKKKKTKSAATTDPIAQKVVASSSADYSSETSAKPKTKNVKRQQQPQPSSSQITKPLQQSTASIDTDGSWTRVGPVRRDTALSKNSAISVDATTSDADTGLTPHTGNSSPIVGRGTEGEEPSSFLLDIGSRDSGESHRKTLAEKLLPKPRKTGVDDMLETPDYPTLARVMRVQPLPDEKPASGFSWADYEDVRVITDGGENDADGEDDGWGVVKSKRQKVDRTSTLASSSHHAQRASETMTKRQRQNAQKRDNEKAAKAEAETQRLAVLAKHKRELEKARILEQYNGKSGPGKSSSGGMKASVDERGKLVWE